MSEAIYSRPGAPVYATLQGAGTGLVGTAGVQLIDNATGTTAVARSTAHITEPIAGSGDLLWTGTAPAAGAYTIFWDTGSIGPDSTATDQLIVTATGSPSTLTYDLSTDVGKVRFEIDDTDVEAPELQDAEIESALVDEGTVLSASAKCCEVLARRYARAYDVASDDQKLSRSQRAAAMRELAKDLRARVEGLVGIGTIPTEKVDGYNDTGVDNESSDGTSGSTGRVRQGYLNPDQVP